jgi:hypothetical protein
MFILPLGLQAAEKFIYIFLHKKTRYITFTIGKIRPEPSPDEKKRQKHPTILLLNPD